VEDNAQEVFVCVVFNGTSAQIGRLRQDAVAQEDVSSSSINIYKRESKV
jgi:hypothetical protein